MHVSPQKSCEPSPSKVVNVVGSEHLYASATDNAQSEVKQMKKTEKILSKKFAIKRKKMKCGRAYEKSKRQTIGFKSQQQNLFDHNIIHI